MYVCTLQLPDCRVGRLSHTPHHSSVCCFNYFAAVAVACGAHVVSFRIRLRSPQLGAVG
jgi:hypothetical protein